MVSQNAVSWAARFLELGQDAGQSITNMKLQKLVTLAESLSEYARATPAFVDQVQAWDHGPAIYPVYFRYKSFSNAAITTVDRSETRELAHDEELIAREVWGVAGQLSAGALRQLTHEVGPWPVHYKAGIKGIGLPGDELGAAWPKYVAFAQRLKDFREPVHTEIVGRGADGFRSERDRLQAAEGFRLGRPSRTGGRP